MPKPDVACIIVAAGAGTRLGAGAPKAFVDVAGASMLERSIAGVLHATAEIGIVVVVPAGYERAGDEIARRAGARGHRIVVGGDSRQASVAAGLAAVGDVSVVLVHDAARCLTPADHIDRVVDAVRRGAAAVVPVLPVTDTIRQADDAVLGGVVDRAGLRAMQTPQGFDAQTLRRAYDSAVAEFTDDAALVQSMGVTLIGVPGDERAFKITGPHDLSRAAALLGDVQRVGIGTDVHAFSDAGVLQLAGLSWPGIPALVGHSDGDAVAHAVVDALLSAVGAGDIGELVGVDRPEAKDAASIRFLQRAVERLEGEGWRPVNVAVQVVAERPRIGARRDEAQRALTEVVGAPVSISGTTSDGLGFTGRGEGVQVYATALVRRH